MSTSDNLFVATDDSVAEAAGWLADVLEMEPVADADLKGGERLFQRSTGMGSGVVAVRVRPNEFAVIDPEPAEIQALERYPIDLSVRLVGTKNEQWQLHETTAIFNDLVWVVCG